MGYKKGLSFSRQFNFLRQIFQLTALLSLATPLFATPSTIGKLRLIGNYVLSPDVRINSTLVGGLSGIDYDPAQKNWVAISDDKAQYAPVRFYRIKMDYDLERIKNTSVLTTVLFKDRNNHYYHNNLFIVPDAEAIRIDPLDGSIWWTGEGYVGEENRPSSKIRHPSVFHSRKNGDYIKELPPLANIRADIQRKNGMRPNKGLEGLSFSVDGKTLWASMEGPMYQDDTLANIHKGAKIRLTHFTRHGKTLGQYEYILDALPLELLEGGVKSEQGVSDILAIQKDKLIVVERIFSLQGCVVKLYEIDTSEATDISRIPSLAKAEEIVIPVRKKLLYTLDKRVSPNVDNIEGISWGPQLENGHESIVLVTDNHFSAKQHMQFFAFEVIPAP